MKHKKLFISLTAVATVIVFFAIFLMIWFFGDTYKDFDVSEDGNFRKEIEIPGLDEGAIPQGITSCHAEYYVTNSEGKTEAKRQNYFFISAYMADKSPSRIYVVGTETKEVGYVTIKTEDGKDFYGHCGGIALNNSSSTVSTSSAKNYTLWVTGESKVYVAKSSEKYAAAKKTIAQEIVEKAMRVTLDGSDAADYDFSIKFTASFNANCRASFCFYYKEPTNSGLSYDRLYVGEFYRPGNYETDNTHHLTTSNGYLNTAFMYEYNVSTSGKYGLSTLSGDDLTEENKVPAIKKIFSIPEKIQGVAFSGRQSNTSGSNNGMIVLSESYGLANSHLYCFDYSAVTATSNRWTYKSVTGNSFVYEGVYKTLGGQNIPYSDSSVYVYYLDKLNEKLLLNDYSIPAMSEGLCTVTPPGGSSGAVNRVYVLFESAGKKYKTFVREQLKNVYSFYPKAK